MADDDGLPGDPGAGPDPDAPQDAAQGVAASGEGEILKHGAMMAVGTIVSRLTGVLRDMSMTAALGLGIVADIYAVGNTIPNTVYVLTVGGAMNAVFVPQLVRRMRDDSDGGDGFAHRLLTASAVMLLLITSVSLLLAPWLTRIYASPQYTEDQMALATAFARYCLPQVFFYGLFTLMSQVLNARGRFNPPMYAPIANNIVSVLMFGTFFVVAGPSAVSDGMLTPQQTAFLGIGSTVAVAAQALLLIPFLRSSGYRYRPRFDWRGWGLGKTGGLAAWTLGLLMANQVSFIVTTRLATTANVLTTQEGLPPAGIATYQKAYLIFFLPHSIVTVSLVTALLPGLSRLAHERDWSGVSTALSSAIRTVTALVVPITGVMIPLAPVLASLLFGFGASGVDAAQQIGYTTIGMLLGLVPFSIYFILLRGWYSLEDTKTPFFLSLALNAINVVLTITVFALVPTAWKVPSMGLTFGLTYWIMMVVAWPVLSRRVGGLRTAQTWSAVARALLAGAFAGAFALGVLVVADRVSPDFWSSALAKITLLAIGGAGGLATYLLAAKVLRVTEVWAVISMARSKLGR